MNREEIYNNFTYETAVSKDEMCFGLSASKRLDSEHRWQLWNAPRLHRSWVQQLFLLVSKEQFSCQAVACSPVLIFPFSQNVLPTIIIFLFHVNHASPRRPQFLFWVRQFYFPFSFELFFQRYQKITGSMAVSSMFLDNKPEEETATWGIRDKTVSTTSLEPLEST